MFYHRSNIFNFSLILFAIIAVSKTEDYLLNFGTNSEVFYENVFNGNGLAFCSWMKLRDPIISFLDLAIYNEYEEVEKLLFGTIDFEENEFTAYAYENGQYANTLAVDSVVTNYSTWFHVCVNRNESFITFYVNGKPLENYTEREQVNQLPKNIYLYTYFGSYKENYQNGSFFQANVFGRSITAQEAMDMYNCKTVEGEILSWSKILSKSDDISFENNMFIVKGDVPCSTSSLLPGAGMSNSGTGMSNSDDPGSSSGNSNQGSSSDDTDPGSSSGNSNQGSSSGNDTPGSSSAK